MQRPINEPESKVRIIGANTISEALMGPHVADLRQPYPSEGMFWALSFIYAFFTALIFQKVVLPLLPSMHAGHGLLVGDAIVFHDVAVGIAKRVQNLGWSEWSIQPAHFTGNVGLLSLLYIIFGPDPVWFIPFNAAAHALGSLLIYRIGMRLAHGDVGRTAGLIAAVLFLVFPSALQWYGQNHKDAFAITGILLALDAWLVVNDDRRALRLREVLAVTASAICGFVLLWWVRPYFANLVLLSIFASFLVASIWRAKLGVIAARITFILLLTLLVVGLMRTGVSNHFDGVGTTHSNANRTINSNAYATLPQTGIVWRWRESTLGGPFAILDAYVQRASELRVHFVRFGRFVGAGSEVDGDRQPDSFWKAFSYMPRALIVGLFSPFPNTWLDRISLLRLVGVIETIIFYLAFVGCVYTIIRYKSRMLIAGIVFSATLIVVMAYIHPNVGTLYRQRFGLWFFFLLIGCIGWVSLLRSQIRWRPSLQNRQPDAGG